jgi:hypothetical protein
VLEHGHVVETGSHSDLLDAEGMYAKLYRGQFRAGDRVALESMERWRREFDSRYRSIDL